LAWLRSAARDSRSLSAPASRSDQSAATELSPASRPSLHPQAQGSRMPTVNLLWHSTLLSGVAGYVDAAGFVSLVGFFPAHITGELVGDAIALSAGHPPRHAHLWAFPVFVGAVITATLVARLLRHHGLKARAGLLALLTLALALFTASDALTRLLTGMQLKELAHGGFAVAAMGFQSALMRESLTGSCPTTVMTGNLTQVAIDVVDHCVGRLTSGTLRDARARVRLTPVAGSLLVFALGAVVGGFLTRRYGSPSVALPTVLATGLMIQAFRDDWQARATPVRPVAPVPAAATERPAAPPAPGGDSELEQRELRSETRLKAGSPVGPPSHYAGRRRRLTVHGRRPR